MIELELYEFLLCYGQSTEYEDPVCDDGILI
jgi:hypothetical protein